MARYGFDLGGARKKDIRRRRTLIIGFLCLVIVIGCVSFLLLWRSLNYDFNNIFKKSDEDSTQVSTTAPTTAAQFSGRSVFLVVATSDDGKTLRFFELIGVDLQEKTVRVFPLNRDTVATGKGKTTLAELYLKVGVTEFRAQLEKQYGVAIDRYAVVTDTGCKGILNAFGSFSVISAEEIEYDTADMYLELVKGENQLTPDKAYKYLRYLCEQKSEKSAAGMAQLTVDALCAYYTAENVKDADAYFRSVVNRCVTDITIVDFTNAKEKIASLLPATGKEKLKAFVTKTPKFEFEETENGEAQ